MDLPCRPNPATQATIAALRQRAGPGCGTADGVACDLRSLSSSRAAAERVLERHAAVDALMLCAGAALWGSAAEAFVTEDGIEACAFATCCDFKCLRRLG